jgi:hypothetical protein
MRRDKIKCNFSSCRLCLPRNIIDECSQPTPTHHIDVSADRGRRGIDERVLNKATHDRRLADAAAADNGNSETRLVGAHRVGVVGETKGGAHAAQHRVARLASARHGGSHEAGVMLTECSTHKKQ